ncbi:hypothetical protein [sulfur-oxidizing endosymbiont of Gigantopelta aegis]|uniref:hypothetical protein n=1 Tax=sulfur-oxidizing endosymbiont of Gigantopelta aegis TaxID=2794934 RepID=UPI001BE4D261|nr:hypothetical protein [sulfur-oxidizing endosymbiont of Gigantopelta aegis]
MGLNSNSFASPTYMAGVSFTFGGDFGLTLKALTDDKKSRAVGSIGATYYPFAAKTFGFDLGAGYTYSDAAAIVSWDFIQNSVQFSAGYADIDDKKKRYYAPPPVTAPPANNNNLN